jgi:hypothetical protein
MTEAPSTYDSKDDAIHLKNLRTMIEFWRSKGSLNDPLLKILSMLSETYTPDTPAMAVPRLRQWKHFFDILQLVDEDLLFALLTKRQLKTRASIIWAGSAYLRERWMRLKLAFGGFAKIWETQIAMCNTLAQNQKVLFSTNEKKSYYDSSRSDPRRLAHHRRRDADAGKTSPSVDEVDDIQYATVNIGIACETVQPGDNIILVGGVRTPLVIRTTSTTQKLISPAVVPNLMTGRGWSHSIKSEHLTTFSLA